MLLGRSFLDTVSRNKSNNSYTQGNNYDVAVAAVLVKGFVRSADLV